MPRSLSFPSPFSLVFPSHIFLFPVVFFSLFSVLFFFPYERIISSGRGRGFHPLRLGPFPFLSFSHLSSLLISFYSLLFFYFFLSYSSSPMSASFPRDGVGNFTLCTSVPFLFLGSLTYLPFSYLSIPCCFFIYFFRPILLPL